MHQWACREQGLPWSVRRHVRHDSTDAELRVVPPQAGRVQPCEQIVLAPHDALGHPGGAAGVEHDQVVGTPSPGRCDLRRCGCRHLVEWHRPGRAWSRPVIDPQPPSDLGRPIPHPVDAVGECPMEDDCHCIGVVPEVQELIVAVAIVGVDGHEPDPKGGEDPLEVLRRVVEVQRNLVLRRQPEGQEPARHSTRAEVELAPCGDSFTLDHRGLVRLRGGDGLPHVGIVPLRHRDPLIDWR